MKRVLDWQTEGATAVATFYTNSVRMGDIQEVREAFDDLDLASYLNIVINLHKCRFFDSTGVGWIISVLRKLQNEGISSQVIVEDDDLYRLFELTQVNRMTRVYENMADYKREMAEAN